MQRTKAQKQKSKANKKQPKQFIIAKSVPRAVKPSVDKQYDNWLVAAKRDPWSVKPPALGIRAESTTVVQFRVKQLFNPTNSVLKLVLRPYSRFFLGSSVLVDSNSDPALWAPSSNAATIQGMFLGGRVLAGGICVTPTMAATEKPGWIVTQQQPTNKQYQGWFDNSVAPQGVFRLVNNLYSASNDPPASLISGQPYKQLYHTEDYEDLQIDSDIVSPIVPDTTCNHPQLVVGIANSSAATSFFVDAIMWVEVAYRDDISNLFGGPNKYTRLINPSRVLDAEEKVADTPNGMFSAASAMASACNNNQACSAIMGAVSNYATNRAGTFLTRN